ncbi:related to Homologous-pairing protein 2 [Zygosaccharomyces bailii ISA1307]|nr:related to Homologous-pairing protein 2 [Zygosaccharomyces bailii ISA1307]
MPKLTPIDTQNIIEQYLASQYRPLAVNDIVQNLHGQVTKPAAARALECLSQQHRITAKTFGKVTIYSCNERELELPEGAEREQFTLAVLAQHREECRELEKEKASALEALQRVTKEPANDQLLLLQKKAQEDLRNLETMLSKLQNDWDPASEPLINTLVTTESRLDKELGRRNKTMKNLLAIVKDTVRPKDMNEFLVCVCVCVTRA